SRPGSLTAPRVPGLVQIAGHVWLAWNYAPAPSGRRLPVNDRLPGSARGETLSGTAAVTVLYGAVAAARASGAGGSTIVFRPVRAAACRNASSARSSG